MGFGSLGWCTITWMFFRCYKATLSGEIDSVMRYAFFFFRELLCTMLLINTRFNLFIWAIFATWMCTYSRPALCSCVLRGYFWCNQHLIAVVKSHQFFPFQDKSAFFSVVLLHLSRRHQPTSAWLQSFHRTSENICVTFKALMSTRPWW